ncbi:hypothetical protein [Buttiauxella sp.]|uniref:hypothetical protein n=1 Tax=Buttiauxella sp. TaxID=1972222 RepID=UPI003C760551
MPKLAISGLGKVGLMYDADPADMPINAVTDALNVRFAGREVEQGLGSQYEPYYTWMIEGMAEVCPMYLAQPIIYDGFSDGARLVFFLGESWEPGAMAIYSQNMSIPDFTGLTTIPDWPSSSRWSAYKGQINNCPFFGAQGFQPYGKQYDWEGVSTLPGWGEQTGGDQIVVTRRWSCKKLISFGNRLIMMNTSEESSGGVDLPYPTRLRWSGFTQQNAFPINWDDTALNRTPEEAAAAVIDGYAGWMDLASDTQLIDACNNGGTLFVYSERETFSVTPSGNANSPFVTKQVYSDCGVLDLGCVVNAKGYNYVFTGSDFVRHDSVRWESVAEGVCRDWLNEVVSTPRPGAVRLVNYPELNEIWVMTKGDDQEADDCAKTQCLTFNYITNTWSRKSLPYINEAVFAPIAPDSSVAGSTWDSMPGAWDDAGQEWGGAGLHIAQGTMIGLCAAGGVYYLNTGDVEYRHVYSAGAWSMQSQPLQCFIERRGLDLGDGVRSLVTRTEMSGTGSGRIELAMAGAETEGAGYSWDKQGIESLATQRRLTWLVDGNIHGYRLGFNGFGSIPSKLTIYFEDNGE